MQPLRLATRGSALALAQAGAVKDALLGSHPGLAAPRIVTVTTAGDRLRDRALAALGGKGAFTREIDRRVLAGEAEAAVHSMKDMETALPPGLALAALLPRGDARDALVAPQARSLAQLPRGAVVGSASIRRKAQLLRARPDVKVVLFRGNVDTRLARLARGEAAALVLALAGLRRLGRADGDVAPLATDRMLPAAGQGAIGIVCRAGDHATLALLAAIDHRPTRLAVTAERAVLARLDGSCRTPVAAHARIQDGVLKLDAMVLAEDGSRCATASRRGAAREAAALGDDAGQALLRQAGRDLFASRVASRAP